MKKLICLILALTMVLALGACGGKSGEQTQNGEQEKVTGLQIGYAREKVTPENGLSVPLAGYGATDSRMSTQVQDDLYATCMYITDGTEQVLMFTVDVISVYEPYNTLCREAISKATGVPANRIFLSGTHTHSAPDLGYTGEKAADAMATYQPYFVNQTVKAAQAAMADKAKTTVLAANVETKYLNFVRHYELSDGSFFGDNFGDPNRGSIVGYAEEGDHEMVLVKFDREGDAKDILMMNFQAHPCFTGGSTKTIISADFIGMTRTLMERDTGMHFAYFTGAAGNQNVTTKLAADNAEAGKYAEMNNYTKELIRYANEGLANLTPLEGDSLKVNQVMYNGKINHQGEDKLEIATQIYEEYTATGNREAANKKALENGFMSVYHCGSIMRHASMPAEMTMEINAIAIGGLGLINAPFEMFTPQSNFIKDGSPFEHTVIATCTGDMRSYLPSQKAYDYGCYESTSAYYEPGTGELVATEYVNMLGALKG